MNNEKENTEAVNPAVSISERKEPQIALSVCKQAHEIEMVKLRQSHRKDLSCIGLACGCLGVLLMGVVGALYLMIQKKRKVK